jgi:hypothetical protein
MIELGRAFAPVAVPEETIAMAHHNAPHPSLSPIASRPQPALPLAGFRAHLERVRVQIAAEELARVLATPRPDPVASRPRHPQMADRIGRPYRVLVRC